MLSSVRVPSWQVVGKWCWLFVLGLVVFRLTSARVEGVREVQT